MVEEKLDVVMVLVVILVEEIEERKEEECDKLGGKWGWIGGAWWRLEEMKRDGVFEVVVVIVGMVTKIGARRQLASNELGGSRL